MAFLKAEYRVLLLFMLAFAVVIGLLINYTVYDVGHTEVTGRVSGWYTAIAFLFGALISVASGYIGMKVATQGNARTTVAAKQDIGEAFKVAINSGAVMGFALVGLAVLGLVVIYVFMNWVLADIGEHNKYVLMESHRRLWSRRLHHCAVRPRGRRHLHQGS